MTEQMHDFMVGFSVLGPFPRGVRAKDMCLVQASSRQEAAETFLATVLDPDEMDAWAADADFMINCCVIRAEELVRDDVPFEYCRVSYLEAMVWRAILGARSHDFEGDSRPTSPF